MSKRGNPLERQSTDELFCSDRLRQTLADLHMPVAIEELLDAQIQLRNNRRLQAAMRSSRLPSVKRLTEFDFSFQPSLRREQMEILHELGTACGHVYGLRFAARRATYAVTRRRF